MEEREAVQIRQFLSRFIEEIRVDETDAWVLGNLAGRVAPDGEVGSDSQMGKAWLPALTQSAKFEKHLRHGLRDRSRCSILACGRRFYAKGFRKGHYYQAERGTLGHGPESIRGADGLTIVIPADAASALKLPATDLPQALRRELTVHLYHAGLLGIGPARRLADVDKTAFHWLLGEGRVLRHYDEDEWETDRESLIPQPE